MNEKYLVSISISLALAIFFVAPWVSLFEQADALRGLIPSGKIWGRLLFLGLNTFISAMLFFQFNFFWKNKLFGQSPTWLRRLCVVLINLIMVALITWVSMEISGSVFPVEMPRAFFTIHFFRNLGIGSVCILIVYAHRVLERMKSDKIKILTLRQEKNDAEIAMLRNQMNPHFLFNTLNSLAGVIRKNQQEAVRFVSHLSEGFRYTLDKRNSPLVSLQEELLFMESYLYLMKMRFGSGMKIDVQVLPDDLGKKIPQFALQLLVENATKHNVISEKSPLSVIILSEGGYLTVRNTHKSKTSAAGGHGIGLANLNKRYELLGHEPISIARSDTHFEVKIKLI